MIRNLKPKKYIVDELSRVIKLSVPIWSSSVTPGSSTSGIVSEAAFKSTYPPIDHDVDMGKSNMCNILDVSRIDNVKVFHDHHRELNIRMNLVKEHLSATTISNSIVYPPLSSMNWHTNNSNPGYRVYYSFSKGKCLFAYLDKRGKVVYNELEPGWNAVKFKVGDDFWHSIWTEKTRFSFGFAF